MSRGTVAMLELGGDARHSTLVRYRKALPCLGAHQLLLDADAPPSPDSRAAWRFMRDVNGFEAKRVTHRTV